MARKSDSDRGEGLGNEEGLVKADSSDGLKELQEQRDEINERGFFAVSEDQAELLLEEDRAGSLPDPREPKHEQERKDALAKAYEDLKSEASKQD